VGSAFARASARVRASRGRRRSSIGADDDGEGADARSRPRRVAGRADDAREGRGRLARAAADGAAAHAMPGGMRRSRVCASSEGPNETSVGEADSAAARGGDAPREVQRTAKCEVDDVRSLHLFLRACYFVHADASSLDSLRMVSSNLS
jgi:hypothetical protein